MSMCTCKMCGIWIDSDDDPDCFVEKPNYTNTAHPVSPKAKELPEYIEVCESCRDTMETEADAADARAELGIDQ